MWLVRLDFSDRKKKWTKIENGSIGSSACNIVRFIEEQIQTNHSFTKHRQFWWFFFLLHSNFHRCSYYCVVFNAVSSSSSSYSLCRAPFTNKIYPQTHKRHKHHVHLTISPYNILLINCMLHSHSSPSYIHRLWALFLSVPFLSSSYKNHFLLLSLMLTTCLQFIDVKDTNAAG